MYTEEQQLQIAIAYAKTVSTVETMPDEFLSYINAILEKFKPDKEPGMVFSNNKIDSASFII